MKLYLCQHGECVDQTVDANRSLTDQAKTQLQQMMTWLKERNCKVDVLYHSGKLRAQQTAEIFSKVLANDNISMLDGMNPLDDVEPIVSKISESTHERIMLVSHLPFVSNLASYLIFGSKVPKITAFVPGTIVEMETETDNWVINWMIRPNFFE